ncbi:hypothetical protein M4914_01830 [Streptomyces somaliensis DSM 40738]|uniref:Uncharacterized protein n=1 Tax=Streptomyces somaliensis (strain ATCC 33201 / DSM 40738 / JCM 12659 / KCTC 9044 / NCTC 11332 / NRRL B-12077 / IP 733) TaxID=1134445 RepID=A0AA44ICL3_STRE0|nr:hypothetical protein [Streptomyces somaliensis]MCQ0021831.1 hypothetical protein [Streptomyces somaliensis DSM 40738]NKY13794.1 hypothetical protein [Streptomyces somaliensis DSM 40738]
MQDEPLTITPHAHPPVACHAPFAVVHEHGLRPQVPVREAYPAGPAEALREAPTARPVVPVREGTA